MGALASAKHTQRDERQKRYTDRAENELDGEHRGILAHMNLTFSRRLALVFGASLPLIETIRRWKQLGDFHFWPSWLDDVLLGAALLYGAWRVAKDVETGRPWLAAAWGLTCGIAYNSFFGQLAHMDQPDPSALPSTWVIGVKGVGILLAIVALVGSLRQARQSQAEA
jgi:hypothetical protein